MYGKLDSNESLSLADKSATGSPVSVYLNDETLYEGSIKHYSIPGTDEYIRLAEPVYMPRKDGITYLQRAAELLSEKETLADIHFKTGNIFLWAGSKKQAYPYFERSIALVPANVNARLTLVDIYKALYKNRAAMEQLNYLYDSSQINFPKRLLFSEFNIHAGRFEKAKLLLDKAEEIHPYIVPEISELKGRLYLLANKPKEALLFYQRSLHAQKNDVWFTSYSLARSYAQTGNDKEAFKWLQVAIDHGFNYSFVLLNDPYMDDLRKTAKWQTMISSISAKKYRSNFTAKN
jgi:tetratricopeptide (TPR) repeat protein